MSLLRLVKSLRKHIADHRRVTMEERERRVLEKHRKVLVSDIADVEPILDHLVSTGVFRANDDNVQLVRSEKTSFMRARRLLDILPSRGGRI